MHKTIARTAVALSAAALTLGVAGPASAELYGIDDPQDTYHGSDILSLSVRNGQENVHVVSIHEGLHRDPATGSSGVVYFDTDRSDHGPEYVLTAGYFEGTDYVLSATEGFGRRQVGDPVEYGDYMMRVNYRRDRVHLTVSHAALGDPTDVRVAMKASGARTDGTSEGLTDWVGEPRTYTPWIAQGS